MTFIVIFKLININTYVKNTDSFIKKLHNKLESI